MAAKISTDIDRADSPVKSNMATMIAEQFVQLQFQIMQKLTNDIFRLVQHGERTSVSASSNNSKN